MDITMLPSTEVQIVFRHSDLRAIEHRWLIHVIPNVCVQGTTLEFLQRIELRQIISHSWVQKI